MSLSRPPWRRPDAAFAGLAETAHRPSRLILALRRQMRSLCPQERGRRHRQPLEPGTLTGIPPRQWGPGMASSLVGKVRGRLAQRKSSRLTTGRSLVRAQYRPPKKSQSSVLLPASTQEEGRSHGSGPGGGHGACPTPPSRPTLVTGDNYDWFLYVEAAQRSRRISSSRSALSGRRSRWVWSCQNSQPLADFACLA
jgi:hypothetical protein